MLNLMTQRNVSKFATFLEYENQYNFIFALMNALVYVHKYGKF